MTEQDTAIDGLNQDAMTGWLLGLGIDLHPPLTYDKVGLGQSNLTYLATDARGTRLVLRRPPLGELLASAHDVAREHRILSAIQGSGVPLPVVHGLCQDPAVTDVPVMVVSYVEGTVLNERSDAEQLPQPLRHQVGLSLMETLNQIHRVDIDQVGLADLSSRKPYASRQLRRWSGQWELSRTRDLPELEQLTERLRDSEPEPAEVTLVHGDGHLRNIIIDADSAEVRAILDWELSTLGDPLADLGTSLAYWPQEGDPPTMRFDASTVPGFASRAELIEHYATVSGRDMGAVPFWHALGLWKVAIILEGVRRRQRDDPRNLTAAGVIDPTTVDDIVTVAHHVLSGDL